MYVILPCPKIQPGFLSVCLVWDLVCKLQECCKLQEFKFLQLQKKQKAILPDNSLIFQVLHECSSTFLDIARFLYTICAHSCQ